MKTTVILTVIGALGKVTEGLVKGIEDLKITGRMETIQSTALLRSAGILRVLETCCHSESSERPSANAKEKNSQGVKKKIMIQTPVKNHQLTLVCKTLKGVIIINQRKRKQR